MQQLSETEIDNQPMVDEFGDYSELAEFDLSQFDQPSVSEDVVPNPDSGTVAAAMDGGQAQFSARLEQRANSPQKKRAKTNLLGAERWGIRKAHIADISINKIYITRLSSYHYSCLATAYSYAIQQLGITAPTNTIVSKMVEIFNNWHTCALRDGDPRRFQGYITRQLVELYLKEQGHSAVGHQMNQRIWQPMPQQQRLTESQINELNRDRARNWCRMLNLTTTGTKEELRLRLKEHFKK